MPQDNTTGWHTEVRLALVNRGHTPAYEVSYKANADVLAFPLPDGFEFPIPDMPVVSTSVIGPGQNTIMSAALRHLLSPEETEAYMKGQLKRLYMWGIVTYRDIFGVQRQTRYCQSVLFMRDGSTMGVNTRRLENQLQPLQEAAGRLGWTVVAILTATRASVAPWAVRSDLDWMRCSRAWPAESSTSWLHGASVGWDDPCQT